MRNQVKLYEDNNLIETFHFAPIHPGSLSEDDYNLIEKEVAEYCESEKLDFWEDNIHMTINGTEYDKNPRPAETDSASVSGITVEENEFMPYFESPFTKRRTGGGYEFTPKPTERKGIVHEAIRN